MATIGSNAPGNGTYTATKEVTNAPSRIPPSEPRLNWFAENITQVARPVKIIGIMLASTSVKPFTLNVPFARNIG